MISIHAVSSDSDSSSTSMVEETLEDIIERYEPTKNFKYSNYSKDNLRSKSTSKQFLSKSKEERTASNNIKIQKRSKYRNEKKRIMEKFLDEDYNSDSCSFSSESLHSIKGEEVKAVAVKLIPEISFDSDSCSMEEISLIDTKKDNLLNQPDLGEINDLFQAITDQKVYAGDKNNFDSIQNSNHKDRRKIQGSRPETPMYRLKESYGSFSSISESFNSSMSRKGRLNQKILISKTKIGLNELEPLEEVDDLDSYSSNLSDFEEELINHLSVKGGCQSLYSKEIEHFNKLKKHENINFRNELFRSNNTKKEKIKLIIPEAQNPNYHIELPAGISLRNEVTKRVKKPLKKSSKLI